MSKLEALKLSIQHWKRMIWYMKEHREEPVHAMDMLDTIGEWWSGEHCDLCKEYAASLCFRCPLIDKKRGGTCAPSYHKFRAATKPYVNEDCSKWIYPTWSSVLVHAKSVLRRLQKEYKKAREQQ